MGERPHRLELCRLVRRQPVAIVEQRRAHGDRDRQIVRQHRRAEQVAVLGRLARPRRRRRAAPGQERRTRGERAGQVGELPPVACGHIEGEKGGRRLRRRGDPGLVPAVERDAVRAVCGCELVVVVLVVSALGVGRPRGEQVRGSSRCGATEDAPEEGAPRDTAPAALALWPLLGHHMPYPDRLGERSNRRPRSCARSHLSPRDDCCGRGRRDISGRRPRRRRRRTPHLAGTNAARVRRAASCGPSMREPGAGDCRLDGSLPVGLPQGPIGNPFEELSAAGRSQERAVAWVGDYPGVCVQPERLAGTLTMRSTTAPSRPRRWLPFVERVMRRSGIPAGVMSP